MEIIKKGDTTTYFDIFNRSVLETCLGFVVFYVTPKGSAFEHILNQNGIVAYNNDSFVIPTIEQAERFKDEHQKAYNESLEIRPYFLEKTFKD